MIINEQFIESVMKLTSAQTLEELSEEKIAFEAACILHTNVVEDEIMSAPTSDKIQTWVKKGSYMSRQQELFESMFQTKLEQFAS